MSGATSARCASRTASRRAGGDVENFLARRGIQSRYQAVGAKAEEPQRRAVVIRGGPVKDAGDSVV